jgi:predicted lipid-binding transport protein (Tim44 family)
MSAGALFDPARTGAAMSQHNSKWRVFLALCCVLCLALLPALAQARGGSSYGSRPSSFGSRGLRSFENNGAQPQGRSAQPQPGYGAGLPGSAAGGSFFQRHPFLTGLAGGIIGSWLFGHAANAAGAGGAGSFFGTLIWLAIIAGLVWFGLRVFRARAPAARPEAGAGWGARSAGAAASPVSPYRGRDVNPSDADLQAFQRLHAAIQYAWSAGDLGRLSQLMTPEMLSHFSQELARNTSRGVRNLVSNVELLNGELTEAWDEGDRQYASALMRWRAIDYVQRLDAAPLDGNAVVTGDPRRPVEAEEMWTFVRRPGAGWLLSAIQQV